MHASTHSNYLKAFATADELRSWSADVRESLLQRILSASASQQAWRAFVELLFHWPSDAPVTAVVERASVTMQQWDWRLRDLAHDDPVLRRDAGVALRLVGRLIVRDVEDLDGKLVDDLCRSPYLDGLRGLVLHDVETFPSHVARITHCTQLGKLESLECTRLLLSGGLDEVFDGCVLARVTTLALRSAGLVAADLQALALSPPSPVVTNLDLSGNLFSAVDLSALLMSNRYPRLEVLDVSRMSLHGADLQASVSRRRLPSLKKIVLHETPAARLLGNEWQL